MRKSAKNKRPDCLEVRENTSGRSQLSKRGSLFMLQNQGSSSLRLAARSAGRRRHFKQLAASHCTHASFSTYIIMQVINGNTADPRLTDKGYIDITIHVPFQNKDRLWYLKQPSTKFEFILGLKLQLQGNLEN